MKNEYRQIEVILHNAKLSANSGMKRTQKFLVFSQAEADAKKVELEKSQAFGTDSRVEFRKMI